MPADRIHTLRYIEAWEDSGTTQMRSGIIFDDDFENWSALKGNHAITLSSGETLAKEAMGLRLVTSHNPGYPRTIGCSRAVFDHLYKDFNLHRTTEEVFINNNGAFVKYISKHHGTPDIQSMALVIKIPVWGKGCQALSLSYFPETGHIRAFLNWFPDRDHAALVEHIRTMQHMQAFKQPLFLPTYLLRLHLNTMEAYRSEVDESILKIENCIGYAVPGLLYYRPVSDQLPLKSSEGNGLQSLVRRLHASNTELGALSLEARFGRDLGAFLKKTATKLNEWDILHGANDLLETSEWLHHDIRLTTNLCSTMDSQVAVLKDRVSSHINLTFSIIAQEENRLSRAVAQTSKKDSVAMRTIALMTLFFLPPTFVATLFSMTMFDWKGEAPGKNPISSSFWIYWVVAAPLTFLVWFICRIWWKREEQKYMDELKIPA